MPEVDGVEAVKQIRTSCLPAGAEVPVIALAAVAASEELAEIRTSGWDDVETRPFAPDSLRQKMILYARKISPEAISGQASA